MSQDGFDEKDKKKADPSLEVDGLEETADEVEYEAISEGEGASEKADRTGPGAPGEEGKGLKPKIKIGSSNV